jgi:glycosyltransferase involved in cell wall biosynthesis
MAGAAQGGAETAFADICIALKESGVTMEVVTRPNNTDRIGRLKNAGIPVHCLPFGGALDVFTPLMMRKIIRDFQPDIVQTFMSRAAQKTPRWTKASCVKRYDVVARLGGYYKLSHFRSADWFVTITPDLKRWLEDQGVAPDHIRHINNFAETEEGAVPASREAENTPADVPLLVSLGRLHKAKAYDVLLQSMTEVPGVFLWIAGEGPERAALEAQIAALGLGDRVRLLGWRNDRAALLKAANICVFPSRIEPFGTVFVQAWANHTPLVVSAADGPRQFVRDRVDGLVVPVEDHTALAGAIRTMLADPDLAAGLVQAGYEHYKGTFTKDRTTADYINFYNGIVEKRGA